MSNALGFLLERIGSHGEIDKCLGDLMVYEVGVEGQGIVFAYIGEGLGHCFRIGIREGWVLIFLRVCRIGDGNFYV